MSTPEQLSQIAADLNAGKPRRAKVRTLMGYFGLKRRREQGLSAIRAELSSLGISTVPDFETTSFDDQIRFVLIGEDVGPAESDGPNEEPAMFLLQELPTVNGVARFRALLKTYDAYERFRMFLVEKRIAHVLQRGQNSRREERDNFPFYVLLELAPNIEADAIEGWLAEASRLGEAEGNPTESVEEVVASRIEDSAVIRDHVSGLYEAMRADYSRQMSDLREAMETKVDEIRIESIRHLAKELNNDEALKVIQEFETETREKLVRKDQELKEAEIQVALLSAQIGELEEDLIDRDNFDPKDAYPTVSATVALFSDLCDGYPIRVLEPALKSAARSASTRRRELLQFLLTLREFSILNFGSNPQNTKPEGWFASRGYEYAVGDSESTENRYGNQRDVTVDGEKVRLKDHVTLYPNSPNCISIYWYRDISAREFLVGYVGPHLSTSSW